MPLFNFRRKGGSGKGTVVHVGPTLLTGAGIPGANAVARPMKPVPGMSNYEAPKKPVDDERSWNDNRTEEYLKAKSSEHTGYTNRQVGEAKDNAIDNANRFGGPVTTAHIEDALKRLNGR